MGGIRGLGGRLGHNATRVVQRVVARSVLDRRSRDGGLWLLVRIGPRILETRAPALPLMRQPGTIARVDLLRALDAAAGDPRIVGVLLRFEGDPGGFAGAASLRRAIEHLREGGKTVWAWGESYDALQYSVACAADRVELPPSGALHLVGLRTEQWFGREALDKLGVHADVVRVGSSKAAAEPLLRRNMSPEQRKQLNAFQAVRFDELLETIAAGRDMEPDEVRRRVDEGPYSAGDALACGLLDACRYPDEIEDALKRDSDPDEDPPLVDVALYGALHAADAGWQPLARALPRIAYVVASGPIRQGRSARGVASQRYSELLSRLGRDDDVRGVVLRVDSPGGDAVASDLLHRAITRLAERKPVVVSIGEVAASGGYYLAAGASRILAERGALTGSIGVVGGKLDLSGLLERLGIDVDAIERGERAGLQSPARGFTPGERGALQRQLRAIYATFKERVASGRSLSPEAVEAAAQGRIWSGERAREIGLVDARGGPIEALAEVIELAGLPAGARFLVDVHPQRGALVGLREWLGELGYRSRVRLH